MRILIDTIPRIPGPRPHHRRVPAGGRISLDSMPMYAMLSTLGPGGWETLQEKPDRIREVAAEVAALGITVHAQYALMGQYDFLNILEAPDEETMAKAAIMLASRGTMRTTTLPAIPVDQLIARLKTNG
jgi:uncharacterized protein with GYD domain